MMKIVFVIALALLLASSNALPEPCTEGQTYTQDCNTCFCTNTGVYACTRKACFLGPQFPDTVTEAPKAKRDVDHLNNPACDKGASYFDGCNTCVCQENLYICTKKYCFTAPDLLSQPSKATVSKRDVPTTSPACDKGPSYFDGCNTCVCHGNIYACTLKLCFAAPVILPQPSKATVSKRDVPTSSEGCDKGPSYFDGCNTCTCMGNVYACTLRHCFEGDLFPDTVYKEPSKKRREIEESTGKYDPPKESNLNILRFDAERCTPKEVKNQDCNRCKCTKNGKGWLCTRKLCPQEEY